MKDIVNHRVKHREHFRPFAPAVPEAAASRYFNFLPETADLGFMTFTVNATADAQKYAPAVVHVDKTGRIQTVRKERETLYADVILRFGELTGNPVILNTSFNDMGEPIVETPENAVSMFMKSDMDVLCIGNVVGVKK
jgi:carbamoyltransferase